jgi:hypothetical protein
MIKFKTPLVEERFKLIHPTLKDLCSVMAEWCADHSLEFVLTETLTTLSEDNSLQKRDGTIGRISASHREGRACDLSVKNWPMWRIEAFVSHFNERYQSIAAVSKSDGAKRLCVFHDGTAPHIHLQLNKSFTVEAS